MNKKGSHEKATSKNANHTSSVRRFKTFVKWTSVTKWPIRPMMSSEIKEKSTFRHPFCGWPTLVVNWSRIYQSETTWMKTMPRSVGGQVYLFYVLINGWRDTRSTKDGLTTFGFNESSMIDHGIPGPQFNAKEEQGQCCFCSCLQALVLLVGPFGLLVPRRAGDGGQTCGTLKTLNVLTCPFVPWVRFSSPRSHQSQGTKKKC